MIDLADYLGIFPLHSLIVLGEGDRSVIIVEGFNMNDVFLVGIDNCRVVPVLLTDQVHKLRRMFGIIRINND